MRSLELGSNAFSNKLCILVRLLYLNDIDQVLSRNLLCSY